MILQKLLSRTDIKEIIRIWEEKEIIHRTPEDGKTEDSALRELIQTLLSMRANAPSDYVLLSLPYGNEEAEYLNVVLCTKETMLAKMRDYITNGFEQSSQELFDGDWKTVFTRLDFYSIRSIPYMCEPWEDIIGAEVWMPNVMRYGIQDFLARVLAELSWHGYNKEERDAAVLRLREWQLKLSHVSADEARKKVDHLLSEEVGNDTQEDPFALSEYVVNQKLAYEELQTMYREMGFDKR